jgi:hypothetical protein
VQPIHRPLPDFCASGAQDSSRPLHSPHIFSLDRNFALILRAAPHRHLNVEIS